MVSRRLVASVAGICPGVPTYVLVYVLVYTNTCSVEKLRHMHATCPNSTLVIIQPHTYLCPNIVHMHVYTVNRISRVLTYMHMYPDTVYINTCTIKNISHIRHLVLLWPTNLVRYFRSRAVGREACWLCQCTFSVYCAIRISVHLYHILHFLMLYSFHSRPGTNDKVKVEIWDVVDKGWE